MKFPFSDYAAERCGEHTARMVHNKFAVEARNKLVEYLPWYLFIVSFYSFFVMKNWFEKANIRLHLKISVFAAQGLFPEKHLVGG